MNWNSLPIKRKLSYSFSALIALFTVGGLMVITTLININRSAKEMHNSHLPALTRINNLESSWQQSIFFLRSYTQHKTPSTTRKPRSICHKRSIGSIQNNKDPRNKNTGDSISNALQKFKIKPPGRSGHNTNRTQLQQLDSAIANLQNYSTTTCSCNTRNLKTTWTNRSRHIS